MATKKILYLATLSEWGGAQRSVYDLATGLKSEYEVVIAAGEGNGELFQILEHKSIRAIKLKYLKREIRPLSDLLAFFELIKVIKQEKPDIIHLNSSKISIIGSLAIKWLKMLYPRLRINDQAEIDDIRTIYTAHGWVFNEPLAVWKKKFYLWAEKWTAKFKDKIICVSEYDKQVALDNHIAKEDKLITIHNGIAFNNLKFFDRDDSRQKLFQICEQRYGIRDSQITAIGTIANLYPTKGIEYLIEAAARVVKTDNKILFLVIGEGQEKNKLGLKIRGLKLENNFYLLGNLPEAYQYLKAFDLFILPSVKEGLPYTVLEALSAKLPVIAANVGGLAEIIKDNFNGLLVEPKNPDQLAQTILKLLGDKNLQQKLIGNIDLSEFSLAKMIENTNKQYKLNNTNIDFHK